MLRRIKFTLPDYYDYVGTTPNITLKRRVMRSIPNEFSKAYNVKWKKVTCPFSYYKHYRVSLTINITDEQLESFLDHNERKHFQIIEWSWKPALRN